MNRRFEEKIKVTPVIPKEFGEDGGHFYRYYDELAAEIDDDMVKSLKAQLDGILIFAGLFAGVNSAFLALTLPGMSADPADDTNALLLQLVTGGTNGTIQSKSDLPSASFAPPAGLVPINVLFSLSLTFALLSSFLAVLGQQWLVYYQKRSGGGAEAQRWEQLRRYLGAKRWRLEAVLDDVLPSMLQLGLVIFCVAFVLYLKTLSTAICYTIAVPVGLAFTVIVAMAICSACDNWCPFKSPLSHLLQLTPEAAIRPILLSVGWVLILASKTIACGRQIWLAVCGWKVTRACKDAASRFSKARLKFGEMGFPVETHQNHSESGGQIGDQSPAAWLLKIIPRRPEPKKQLKLLAVKRVLLTSEDHNALMHAAANLRAVLDAADARALLDDSEFYENLTSQGRIMYTQVPGWTAEPTALSPSLNHGLLHLALRTRFVPAFLPPHKRYLLLNDLSTSHYGDGYVELYKYLNAFTYFEVQSSCPTCVNCTTLSICNLLLGIVVKFALVGDGEVQFRRRLGKLLQMARGTSNGIYSHPLAALLAVIGVSIRVHENLHKYIFHGGTLITEVMDGYNIDSVGQAVESAFKAFSSTDISTEARWGLSAQAYLLILELPFTIQTSINDIDALSSLIRNSRRLLGRLTKLLQDGVTELNDNNQHDVREYATRCARVVGRALSHASRIKPDRSQCSALAHMMSEDVIPCFGLLTRTLSSGSRVFDKTMLSEFFTAEVIIQQIFESLDRKFFIQILDHSYETIKSLAEATNRELSEALKKLEAALLQQPGSGNPADPEPGQWEEEACGAQSIVGSHDAGLLEPEVGYHARPDEIEMSLD